jgi:hypothetical protein
LTGFFIFKKLRSKVMKTKDTAWYDQKLETIKKRKRKVYLIEDPKARKRVKADLKREQRGAKRTVKNSLKKWIQNEIDVLGND